jgi:hypothetical protein
LLHYIFNDLVRHRGRPGAIWDATPPIDAAPAHSIQRLGARPDGLDRALEVIDSRLAPLYKLDWRVDADDPYWAGVLDALAAPSCEPTGPIVPCFEARRFCAGRAPTGRT